MNQFYETMAAFLEELRCDSVEREYAISSDDIESAEKELAKKSGAYADYLKGLSDGDRIFLDEYMNVLNHAHFKEEQRVVGNCMRPITKAGGKKGILPRT